MTDETINYRDATALPRATETKVFRRDFAHEYRTIVRGSGVWLYDADGRRFLDAVGGAAVVTIGHGVERITRRLHENFESVPYVYGDGQTTQWQEELAARVVDMCGIPGSRAYFVSGGSEANETAIKMARQYHVERGTPSKHKVIARWQSFHGVTLGALSLSGRTSWREAFDPYLIPFPHIVPPYCYRCPFGKTYPSCNTACADDLERQILMEGPATVAAFIAEPIIGTTVTGVTPVPDYYAKIREICDRYDVLFIADEVLTGSGRTGLPLAIHHWGVEPDIVTLGKGLSSGYVALAAAVAGPKVVEVFANSGGRRFTHGLTFSGLPIACFIGLQVLEYLQENKLFDRAARMGQYLDTRLSWLAERHEIVGDVRVKGLLAGVEFVANKATREPLPSSADFARRLADMLEQDYGVLIRPGVPNVNYGRGGDHIQITPPYIIEREEIDQIVDALDGALSDLEPSVARA